MTLFDKIKRGDIVCRDAWPYKPFLVTWKDDNMIDLSVNYPIQAKRTYSRGEFEGIGYKPIEEIVGCIEMIPGYDLLRNGYLLELFMNNPIVHGIIDTYRREMVDEKEVLVSIIKALAGQNDVLTGQLNEVYMGKSRWVRVAVLDKYTCDGCRAADGKKAEPSNEFFDCHDEHSKIMCRCAIEKVDFGKVAKKAKAYDNYLRVSGRGDIVVLSREEVEELVQRHSSLRGWFERHTHWKSNELDIDKDMGLIEFMIRMDYGESVWERKGNKMRSVRPKTMEGKR